MLNIFQNLTICTRYQETVLENHSSDDNDPEEYNARPFKMDSEDDGD